MSGGGVGLGVGVSLSRGAAQRAAPALTHSVFQFSSQGKLSSFRGAYFVFNFSHNNGFRNRNRVIIFILQGKWK